MANTLTNDIDKILSMGLVVLRENAIMPRLVNRNYDSMAARKGSTIDIPIANDFSVRAVSPGVVHSASGMNDINPTLKQCTLDKWYESPFVMSDKEYMEAQEGVIPRSIESAVKSIANQVDQDIMALYKKVGNSVGTAGTTPYASNIDIFLDAQTYLYDNLMPANENHFSVHNAAGYNAALKLGTFHQADQTGDQNGIVNGYIGRKFGADWHIDQNVPTHTCGTLSNGTGRLAKIDNASVAIGDTSVDMDDTSLSGTITAGDLFTVAGDSQTYTVLAAVTASGNALSGVTFFPAAKVAWADDAVVTFKGAAGATYKNNLIFHPDAFVLASRPLQDVVMPGSIVRSMVDELTGLTLRLEVSRQNKQTQWSFDVLYGVTELRPELAARILG